MQKLFALILVFTLWFGFAPTVNADEVANLTPCAENPAYLQRAENFRNTTSNPNSGAIRAERYAEALCGPEGYPHLIVDGRWSHMGDFFIPSVLFLYIAGWIGWVGRSYLIEVREDKNTEMKEIIVEVPLALKKMIVEGPLWPILAFKELTSGELTARDNEVPISPR